MIGLCIGAAYELNHSGPEALVGLLIGTAAGVVAALFTFLCYLDFH